MLSYAEGAVTKNASEKKINSLLDFMAGASDMNVSEVYLMTGVKGFRRARGAWIRTARVRRDTEVQKKRRAERVGAMIAA